MLSALAHDEALSWLRIYPPRLDDQSTLESSSPANICEVFSAEGVNPLVVAATRIYTECDFSLFLLRPLPPRRGTPTRASSPRSAAPATLVQHVDHAWSHRVPFMISGTRAAAVDKKRTAGTESRKDAKASRQTMVEAASTAQG